MGQGLFSQQKYPQNYNSRIRKKPIQQVSKFINIKKFQGRQKLKLGEHSKKIYFLLLLNDLHFASCSHDGTIKIWKINQIHCKITLNQSEDVDTLHKLDNRRIASGNYNIVLIWNWQERQILRKLTGHKSLITQITKLNSNQIISCNKDKTIKIWNLSSGYYLEKKDAHTDKIYSIILVDQIYLISIGLDGIIRKWQLPDFQLIKEKNLNDELGKAQYYQKDQIAVSSTNKIFIVKISTLDILKSVNIDEEYPQFSVLHVIAPDLLLTSNNQHSLIILGNHLDNTLMCLSGHSNYVRCAIHTNNNLIISCSEDKSIIVWE